MFRRDNPQGEIPWRQDLHVPRGAEGQAGNALQPQPSARLPVGQSHSKAQTPAPGPRLYRPADQSRLRKRHTLDGRRGGKPQQVEQFRADTRTRARPA